MTDGRESAKVVIIGGGVIGLGIAYHLGLMGERDVLLLERNRLTSGTSWHAAGIVGPLRASMNLTKLAIHATELFPRLEAETGQGTGYRRTGGLWLARTPDRMIELQRICAMGEMAGLDARMIGPEDAGERAGNIAVDDLSGALWVAEDGQANPVDICMAYAKGAKAAGVRITEGAKCVRFEIANGRIAGVRLSRGETIACGKVVLAAGAWSRDLAALAGVPVPLQAVEHMYVVTEPIAGLRRPYPIVRDLDGGIYIKEDAGRLVIGGFEPDGREFIGREAMLARQDGSAWRMELSEIGGDCAVEPFYSHAVLAGEDAVGIVTSGAFGHRTGKRLALALLKPGTGEGPFHVLMLGERFPARILTTPPYDSRNLRMRGEAP